MMTPDEAFAVVTVRKLCDDVINYLADRGQAENIDPHVADVVLIMAAVKAAFALADDSEPRAAVEARIKSLLNDVLSAVITPSRVVS